VLGVEDQQPVVSEEAGVGLFLYQIVEDELSGVDAEVEGCFSQSLEVFWRQLVFPISLIVHALWIDGNIMDSNENQLKEVCSSVSRMSLVLQGFRH
jgi:hypothetical protein